MAPDSFTVEDVRCYAEMVGSAKVGSVHYVFSSTHYRNLSRILEKDPKTFAPVLVIPALDEQLANGDGGLFETLLRVAPEAITANDVSRYAKKVGTLQEFLRSSRYGNLSRILEKDPKTFASVLVIPALNAQLANCDGGLFSTLLRVAPEAITANDVKRYAEAADSVHEFFKAVHYKGLS